MIKEVRAKIFKDLSELFNSSSHKGLIARGSIWLGAGSGTENSLRLVRNMILARLMAPDAFGFMAIILAVNALFESFTQIGVREAIIQNPKGNEDTYINGAFWLAFVRGVILYTLAIIIVPLVARFYSSSELVPMMRVAFLSILFNGAMSPKAYTALKQMNYKKWVIVFHGGSIIGISTAITLGLLLQNVWALVIGFAVEASTRCFLSFVICPFRPGFNFERESLQSLFRFARGMLGLPILYFLYNRIDIFVIGKLCSTSELGMYSIAYSLARIPFILISTIVTPILLPAFSSLQRDRALLVGGVLRSSRYIACFFLPLLTLMACSSSYLLSLLYGEQYAAVSLTFMIFCASMAVLIVGTVLVAALIAIGKPQLTREASLVRVIVMVVLVVPLVMKYGLNGAAVASLISAFAWIGISLMRIKVNIGLSVAKYIYTLSVGIIVSIFIGGVWWVIM